MNHFEDKMLRVKINPDLVDVDDISEAINFYRGLAQNLESFRKVWGTIPTQQDLNMMIGTLKPLHKKKYFAENAKWNPTEDEYLDSYGEYYED